MKVNNGCAMMSKTASSLDPGKAHSASDANSSGKAKEAFPDTRWSLILHAGGDKDTRAHAAWDEISRIYWYPIYSYVRRRGKMPEEAEDITQRLFYEFLKHGSLKRADPSRGRFRSFILKSVANLMNDQHRRESAQKRGGDREHVAFHAATAEERYRREPVVDVTPETLFDRACALEFIKAALRELESEYRRRGAGRIFDKLSPYLSRKPGPEAYEEVSRALQTTPATTRSHLHRLRKRFFRHFRNEVSQTLENEARVDEEIQHLLEALGQRGAMEMDG